MGKVTKQSLTTSANNDLTFNKDNYFTSTNSGNDYSITTGRSLSAITAGMEFKVKINADSSGNATLNIDTNGASNILKASGANVDNLKQDGIYTFVSDGTNFTLQGEGASGDAIASDLLSGKTASTDAGEITGTMPDRAGDTASLSSSVSGTTLKLRASEGYRDGTNDNVTITDADFVASNILSGKNIFGVDGSAVAGKPIAYGNSFSSGVKITTGFRPKMISILVYQSAVSNYYQFTYSDGSYFQTSINGYRLTYRLNNTASNVESGYNISVESDGFTPPMSVITNGSYIAIG